MTAYAGKAIAIEGVTFDNNVVTATSFVGALTGNASTATSTGKLTGLTEYASNALALAGGKVAGDLYTTAGVVMIVTAA
jgi:hypothetical protein